MRTILNRRTLLHAAAAGLAGAAVARRSAFAVEPPPKRKFTMALSCGMIGVRATPREAIDLAGFLGSLAKIGYDGPIAAEPFLPDLRSLPRDEALEKVAAAMKKAFALVEPGGA